MRKFQGLLIWPATLLSVTVTAHSSQGPAPMRAVDRTLLDTTYAPCEDFYRFANGAWLDTVTIPPGQASWGPLPALRRRTNLVVADLLDSLAIAPERHAQSSVDQKVGAYYRACVEATTPGEGALAAVEPEIDHIDAIRTTTGAASSEGCRERGVIQRTPRLGGRFSAPGLSRTRTSSPGRFDSDSRAES
jgi:predicted metalloendopeptidase